MNDKEKQIEEMAKDLIGVTGMRAVNGAKYLYKELNYRKLPEDSVVLTKEEWASLQGKAWASIFKEAQILQLEEELKQARKETAREIAFAFESRLAYNENDDKFTKTEILNMVKDLLKDYVGVEIKE